MNKILMAIALLATGFSANASVILGSGESFSSSFQLISDGDVYKLSDNFWDVLVSFDGSIVSSDLELTLFENVNLTNQVLTSTFGFNNANEMFFGGGDGFFLDHDGSLTLTYTGPGSIELTEIFVANFSGTLDPSSVAFATIIPSVSQVPLPAAGWLMLSGLGLLGFVRRR